MIDEMQVSSSNTPIAITADGVSASISKFDTNSCTTTAVWVDGDVNYVIISDSLIREWNILGTGFPAFQVTPSSAGSIINVSNTFYNNGHGGAVSVGNVILTAVVNAPYLN
jgi:hypothetical protein